MGEIEENLLVWTARGIDGIIAQSGSARLNVVMRCIWMKIAIMACRSAPRGLKAFFGCLLLCLLAFTPAVAQDENFTGIGANLKDYAELSFAVPSGVVVEAESLYEENYTEGRYVAASFLFNESIVWILLLYPCDLPGGELNATGLKSAIEGYNPGLNQTAYNPAPLNVSDRPAIWGQAPPPLDNFALVAYQPSNQTVSAIFIDQNVTEEALAYFPESLQINVSESSSPLWPGYCAGDEDVEAAAALDAASAQDGAPSEVDGEISQTEQIREVASDSNKEQMYANLEAIEALKKRKGFPTL